MNHAQGSEDSISVWSDFKQTSYRAADRKKPYWWKEEPAQGFSEQYGVTSLEGIQASAEMI